MKKFEKKAFFFDFDGTLWFGRYGEKTLEGLKTLHENGHLLFFNSGRSKGNTPFALLENIPFDGFLHGGVHAEFKGKTLYREDVKKEALQKVLEAEKTYNLHVIFEGVNGVYKRKGICPFIPCEEIEDTSIFLDTEKYPITKFDFYREPIPSTDGAEVEYYPIPKQVDTALSEDFDVIDMKSYCEYLQKGTGKDFIVKKVIASLNLSIENCYFFGDSMNDYSVFTLGGTNVAIAKSPQKLKDLANYVTCERENGVYEALVHFGFI